VLARPALAQTDLMGTWRPLPRNQDGSGMTGDIAGVPVTDAARWRAQSWSPEDFDVTEWACRPHAWAYSLEGPLSALRLWAEIDQATQKVIAYHGHLNMQEQESTIWMDGRPHPPANALHTWSGFSTGAWDGDTLVVTTTHVKEAYLRRSGLMQSDQATVRTRWRRMGDYLQATVIIYDPVMMTEPYIRSTMIWVNDPAMNMSPYLCEEATETALARGQGDDRRHRGRELAAGRPARLRQGYGGSPIAVAMAERSAHTFPRSLQFRDHGVKGSDRVACRLPTKVVDQNLLNVRLRLPRERHRPDAIDDGVDVLAPLQKSSAIGWRAVPWDDHIPIKFEGRVNRLGPIEDTAVHGVVGVEARCHRSGWIQTAAVARVEAVPCHDDPVRGEIDERVAIGMTAAEVPEINFLSAQKDRQLIGIGERRRTRKFPFDHVRARVDMADNHCPVQFLIAARMVAVRMCVDHVSDWFAGECLDRCDQFVVIPIVLVIDENHPFIGQIGCRIAAIADYHVQVVLNPFGFQRLGRLLRVLSVCGPLAGGNDQRSEHDCQARFHQNDFQKGDGRRAGGDASVRRE